MSRKSSEKMLLLKEALKLELPSFVLTESVGAAGDLCLTVADSASPSTQEEVAFIRIVQRTYTGFPTPSMASAEDGRAHLLQVAIEALTGHATVACWSAINLSKLLARLIQMNMEVQLYLVSAGNDAVEADITASLLKGEIRADVRHPNSGD